MTHDHDELVDEVAMLRDEVNVLQTTIEEFRVAIEWATRNGCVIQIMPQPTPSDIDQPEPGDNPTAEPPLPPAVPGRLF
ncbi:MAG: hypothetical protein AAFP90_01110 [Planctomycetota bacterium]